MKISNIFAMKGGYDYGPPDYYYIPYGGYPRSKYYYNGYGSYNHPRGPFREYDYGGGFLGLFGGSSVRYY